MEPRTLALSVADAVATVRIDHPPVNAFDLMVQRELTWVLDLVEADPSVAVLVLESAQPEFFVAHYDVAAILEEDPEALRTTAGSFNALVGRLQSGRIVTIGKVRGAARGGGCELLLGLDMRFAARESARFAFPEAALGILAAGGGTQRLPPLVGRARALELLLGCDDLDAEAAERYGLVNRALPDDELDGFVARLARRIAALPDRSRDLAKLAVSMAAPAPAPAGLAFEALALDLLKAQPDSRERLRRFLAAGGQTVEGERSFDRLLDDLG